MKLDEKTLELIAVGASVAANCRSCVEFHAKKAEELGADAEAVADAVEMGKRVRKGAGAGMDRFLAELGNPAPRCRPSAAEASQGCCS
jgi:AhpD family alkylhydroperoxidase